MRLQLIEDGYGQTTGVFIPINDWNAIVQKHGDLKDLVDTESALPKKKLSGLAGKLSQETGGTMLQYVAESREEWEERMNEQL